MRKGRIDLGLEELGIKMVIYANQGLRAAVSAMSDVYRDILDGGCTTGTVHPADPEGDLLLMGLQGACAGSLAHGTNILGTIRQASGARPRT